MQPVLVHLSKNKQGSYSFDPVSINFLTEIAKTVFALATLFIFVSIKVQNQRGTAAFYIQKKRIAVLCCW
jgi:hypothetical protein